MSYENNARVINDDIFDLVNQCFSQERSSRNIEGRVNFFDTYNNYFVLTDDGSYSINSKEINHKVETLHTSTGAISESFEKFIKPMKFNYDEDIAILDICAGIGYNPRQHLHAAFWFRPLLKSITSPKKQSKMNSSNRTMLP